jgi:hypothetical protein
MSDIRCAKCGEPWDAYGVRNGDMDSSEASKFMRGEGCPSCNFGRGSDTCELCKGTGKVDCWAVSSKFSKGKILFDCPECEGTGKPKPFVPIAEAADAFVSDRLDSANTDAPDEVLAEVFGL